MKVLMTGGSGMVGKALTTWLVHHNCPVVHLVRRPVQDKLTEIFWDPVKKELDSSLLVDFDVVIHMAGENVAKGLWTASRKKEILDSRVKSTEFLAEKILAMETKPKLFITASGLHIYGRSKKDDGPFTEDSPENGKDFLSDVIRKWEGATELVKKAGIRTCHMRFGGILSPTGGMLKKMLPIFKFAAGGRLGNGKQMMSWVDLHDTVRSIWHCMEKEELSGAINVVAPEVVSNKEFTKALSQAVGMINFIPVPEFILSGVLGDMGDGLMLASLNCAPLKLVSNGFEFEYPTLRESLNFQLKSNVPALEATEKTEKADEEATEEAKEEV